MEDVLAQEYIEVTNSNDPTGNFYKVGKRDEAKAQKLAPQLHKQMPILFPKCTDWNIIQHSAAR